MDYSILKQQIVDDIKEDSRASSQALKRLIKEEKANYQTAAEYSKVFGDSVSKSITKNIGEGIPDDELGEFASECLAPVYKQSQDTMLNACKSIQKIYNKQAGIELNPAEVKNDESRIQHIVERFDEAEKFEDVKFLTNANVARSITRGAVQDSIKSNSKMQSDAGLKIRISRSDGSGCCDWCSTVVGTFDSFDALPDGFWGIHRGCNCVIDYRVGNTKNRIHFETDEKGKLSKVTEKIEAAATPSGQNTKQSNGIQSVIKANNIPYVPVSKYSTMPTKDEIIQKISGGDMTTGSCASLCLAYMGNLDGFDVTDFRGGISQSTFSRYSNLDKIFSISGIDKIEKKEYNGIKAAMDLLNQMQEGKEYCLIAGKHASMVRVVQGKFEYLELQSATKSGWTQFNGNPRLTLKNRFGAKQSSTSYGQKLQQRAVLIDSDSVRGKTEFQDILGYINTNASQQQKGAKGFVK